MKNRMTFLNKYEHYKCGEIVPMANNNRENEIVLIDEPADMRVPSYLGIPKNVMVERRRYIAGPIVDRLYAYEDLGYEPEELKKLIDSHTRYIDTDSLYPKVNLQLGRAYGKTMIQSEIYKMLMNSKFGCPFEIKDVIFNDPATIVFWADGTKTIVKTQNGEEFDPEKGLMAAITKKALGNKGNYYNVIDKWVKKYIKPVKKTFAESISEAATALKRMSKALSEKHNVDENNDQ